MKTSGLLHAFFCRYRSRLQLISLLIFCQQTFPVYAQFSCAGLSTTSVGYTGAPQDFVVPAGVSQIRISITGASGGVASQATNDAGGGATVYAYVNVVQGDVFRILVGQKGVNSTYHAGGGGASAVYKNGVLLMVAGAGGGEDNTGHGASGAASEDGVSGGNDSGAGGGDGCGSSPFNGRGGTAGGGGYHGEWSANCPHGGGGGGGLLSPGLGNGNLNAGQPGGQGNINGAAGGAGSLDDAVGVNGGWGWAGGGGADDRESGGGGGYSGGGGGPESRHPGGGGSYVAAIGTNGIVESGKADGIGTTTGYDGQATICSSPPVTLPARLSPLTVVNLPVGNQIQWTSFSETNTAWYQVERSSNGNAFVLVGTVAAAGNSNSRLQYTYEDATGITGRVYYRLKLVDADGSVSYSDIILVTISATEQLSVYPNPAVKNVRVQVSGNWPAGNNWLQLLNTTGRVVYRQKLAATQQEINVQQLPAGVYVVQWQHEATGRQLSSRLVITSNP